MSNELEANNKKAFGEIEVELFNYFKYEHGVLLLESDIDEVVRIIEKRKATCDHTLEYIGETMFFEYSMCTKCKELIIEQ